MVYPFSRSRKPGFFGFQKNSPKEYTAFFHLHTFREDLRVDWRNPHVVIFMDVKDETGKVVTWGFENAGVSQLAQEGYNRNTLKIGQEITAIVNPAVNGAPTAIVVKVILADGSEIMSRERGQNPID